MYCPFIRSIYCVITNWRKDIFYQNYRSYWSRADCASGRRLLSLWYKPPVFHTDSWTKRSWLSVWGYQRLRSRRSRQSTGLRWRVIRNDWKNKMVTQFILCNLDSIIRPGLTFSFTPSFNLYKDMWAEKRTNVTCTSVLISNFCILLHSKCSRSLNLNNRKPKYQTCGLWATTTEAIFPRRARVAVGGSGSSRLWEEAANRTGSGWPTTLRTEVTHGTNISISLGDRRWFRGPRGTEISCVRKCS